MLSVARYLINFYPKRTGKVTKREEVGGEGGLGRQVQTATLGSQDVMALSTQNMACALIRALMHQIPSELGS